jgi:hypothetical protein
MRTAVLLSLLVLVPSADDEDPAVAAARARQGAVQSLYVEFRQTVVIAPGGLSVDSQSREAVSVLVLDGLKYRYEGRYLIADPNRAA